MISFRKEDLKNVSRKNSKFLFSVGSKQKRLTSLPIQLNNRSRGNTDKENGRTEQREIHLSTAYEIRLL